MIVGASCSEGCVPASDGKSNSHVSCSQPSLHRHKAPLHKYIIINMVIIIIIIITTFSVTKLSEAYYAFVVRKLRSYLISVRSILMQTLKQT